MHHIRNVALLVLVLFADIPNAAAARPLLMNEATYGGPAGDIVVHYATTGMDAPPLVDTNNDGVPDFVAQIDRTAAFALQKFAQLGFARPLNDGVLGGDDRIDIYLRNVQNSDGNAGTDTCLDNRCVGFAIVENDFVGFGYASITEAIESVVPHELFHLIQYSYSAQQSTTWSEGTAVWAVEHLYGASNSDMERFVPAFLSRTFRPFERDSNGFGDAYPYGAALWPYFLEQHYGADVVLATWQHCSTQPFLKAHETALAPLGVTIDQAWTTFTRWNSQTGIYASPNSGYINAAEYPLAPREMPIVTSANVLTIAAMIFIEGMSARYVPITLVQPSRIQISSGTGPRLAAIALPAGQALANGRELSIGPIIEDESDITRQVNVLPAGDYMLVVTGLSRNTIATAVTIDIAPPPEPPVPMEPTDAGGCQSSGHSSHGIVIFALMFLLRRQARSA